MVEWMLYNLHRVMHTHIRGHLIHKMLRKLHAFVCACIAAMPPLGGPKYVCMYVCTLACLS